MVSSNLSTTAQPFQPQTVEQVGILEDIQVSRPSYNIMEQAGSLKDVQVPHPLVRDFGQLVEFSKFKQPCWIVHKSECESPFKVKCTGLEWRPFIMADLLGLFSCSYRFESYIIWSTEIQLFKGPVKGRCCQNCCWFSTNRLQLQASYRNSSRDRPIRLLRPTCRHPWTCLVYVDNTFTDLRSFYGLVEGHIRGLSSLGKSQEKYGDLLIPIIQGKIPAKVRQNLAREHSDSEWNIDELRSTILKEICILEQGLSKPTPFLPDTSSPGMTATIHFHWCSG